METGEIKHDQDHLSPMYLSPNSAMRSNRKNHMTWQMKRIQTKTGSEWN